MNIIRDKLKFLELLFCSFFLISSVYTQENKNIISDSLVFNFKTDLGLGISTKLSPEENILGGYTKTGLSGFGRIYWGKRLNAGFEFNSFSILKQKMDNILANLNNTNFTGDLSSKSIFMIFLFEMKRFLAFGGIGYNRIKSDIKIFDQETISTEWFLGYIIGVGYDYPIFRNCRAGFEIKTIFINEINYSILAFQTKLHFDLYSFKK